MADEKKWWLGEDKGNEWVTLKEYLEHMVEHLADAIKGAEIAEPFSTFTVFPNIAALGVECFNLANQIAFINGSPLIDLDDLEREGLLWSPEKNKQEQPDEEEDLVDLVEGDLRVWVMRNPPSEPETYPVGTPDEAVRTIKAVGDTLSHDRDTIVAAFGLQVWVGDEWVDWTDSQGRNIFNYNKEESPEGRRSEK